LYTIQIVGAGYVGAAIAKHFRQNKQKVTALFRSAAKKELFAEDGIDCVLADLTKPASLSGIPPAHFIILCPAPDKRDEAGYRQVYVEGIRNYLNAIRPNPKPFLIVYLSSTGVWGDQKGAWVDEQTMAKPDHELGKILIEAERQILAADYPTLIFRLAGIYGPGRNRIDKLREGSWPRPGTQDAYMNMIHRDDIVGAMQYLFNVGEKGTVYLGVDDEPVLQSDYYEELCRQIGLEIREDRMIKGQEAGKRCRNARLKSLGFKFRYSTFREGYKALL